MKQQANRVLRSDEEIAKERKRISRIANKTPKRVLETRKPGPITIIDMRSYSAPEGSNQ